MKFNDTLLMPMPWLPLIGVLLAGPAAYSQCLDSTTYVYGQSSAIRLNGNAVRLNGHTEVRGNYYNWWNSAVNVSFYLNNTLQTLSGLTKSDSPGGFIDISFTPTLQTYGTGWYYTSASHDAYAGGCGFVGPVWASQYPGWTWTSPPPWNTADQITIARPTIARSDPPPYYLGGPITSGTYSSQVTLSSIPNGAPETPTYSFTAGSTFATLSCTTCAK